MDGRNTGCETPSDFPEPSDAAVTAACANINDIAAAMHAHVMPPSDVRALIRTAEANAVALRCSKDVALTLVVNELRRRLLAALDDLTDSALIAREYFADSARIEQAKSEARAEARRTALRVV